MRSNPTADNRVRLYPDGKYRWIYEVPMLKNPSILFDVYKVLGISFMIVWLFVLLLGGCEGDMSLEYTWGITYMFILLTGFIMLLCIVAYIIVAWTYGWKYVVLFEMDEKEIKHQQISTQAKKAKKLGIITAIVGAMSGRPSVMGAGMMSASRFSSTSVLKNVEHVIPRRWMNLIKVNQLLNRNRIYVPDEDFDFVYEFLCQHCPKAKRPN